MDPISTVTAVVDAIKKARAVAQRMKDADMMAVLLDAQDQALSLKEDMLNLRNENLALKAQLASHSALKALKFDGQVYWSGEPGDPSIGPFCAHCKDKENKHARM